MDNENLAGETSKTGAFKASAAPPSMAETLDQFSILKLSFEGDEGLEEFLTRFEVHANSYGWASKEKYACLQLAVRCPA
jgi:hypothetical protein